MDSLREKIIDAMEAECFDLGFTLKRGPAGQVANRILAIPEIADALRLKPIKPMPVRDDK